jgi:hypothetical protein
LESRVPLTSRLALLPDSARVINNDLAILEEDDQIVLFNAAGPIYTARKDDRTGMRLGAVTAIRQGLAGVAEMAQALDLHRSTLSADLAKFDSGGVEGIVAKKRGPKAPHKLTAPVRRRAQKLLTGGATITEVARSVGVTRGALYHAIDRGLLSTPQRAPKAAEPTPPVPGPSARALVDQACEPGVAVTRTTERVLASMGKLVEAEPEFQPAEAVPNAGVLLALPALLEQSLLDVGEKVYGKLRNGFFGLRSVLLTFAFMALLRIRNPEQLTEQAPGELGRLLGLDRAPEVKTLRRKLKELGERDLAHAFAGQLTERWAKAEPQELGLLYVDGHVRPYNGRTHTLPKLHVQQRGRPMPGTKDFHVGDRRAEPLFFVTAEATEGLLRMLDTDLLPEVRKLVGPGRRITIAFDREGWSPERFAKWKEEGIDVLTYRKGEQSTWQHRFFEDVKGRVDGRTVEYCLAEREVKLSNGLPVREIRRLAEDGHQTAVITTNEHLPTLQAAYWTFGRWRQENFFRYMRHEFALDHLCTYAVEPADPKRLVTSPQRAALQKKLKAAKSARAKLLEHRVDLAPGQKARVGKRAVGEEELDRLIAKRESEIDKLKAAVAKLPEKVALDTILDPEKIVQLERERKVLVDAIKLTAYRAESTLARRIEPFFARHDDEARKFLKTIFQATADLLPDERRGTLTIRFHGLANPRASRALRELCDLVSESNVCYPGTRLRLRFETLASKK